MKKYLLVILAAASCACASAKINKDAGGLDLSIHQGQPGLDIHVDSATVNSVQSRLVK